jgi:hypothetical protein
VIFTIEPVLMGMSSAAWLSIAVSIKPLVAECGW